MTSEDLDPNHPKWAYQRNGMPRKLVATGPSECEHCHWDIALGDPARMVGGVRYLVHWDCYAHHKAVVGGHLPGRVAKKTVRTSEEMQMDIEVKTRLAQGLMKPDRKSRRRAERDARFAANLLAEAEDSARLLAEGGNVPRIDVESDEVTGGNFDR